MAGGCLLVSWGLLAQLLLRHWLLRVMGCALVAFGLYRLRGRGRWFSWGWRLSVVYLAGALALAVWVRNAAVSVDSVQSALVLAQMAMDTLVLSAFALGLAEWYAKRQNIRGRRMAQGGAILLAGELAASLLIVLLFGQENASFGLKGGLAAVYNLASLGVSWYTLYLAWRGYEDGRLAGE